jgi:hypothetical protein
MRVIRGHAQSAVLIHGQCVGIAAAVRDPSAIARTKNRL